MVTPMPLSTRSPPSAAVKKAELVPADFHARYSCLGKEYVYKIFNARYRDPFYLGRAMFYPKPLDEKKLDEAMQAFCGRHDFRAFMAEGSKVTDCERTVKYCRVERPNGGDVVTLTVAADGFLYNMVRIIAGTAILASEKNLGFNEIAAIISSLDRKNAGATAPACGLYLNKVFY